MKNGDALTIFDQSHITAIIWLHPWLCPPPVFQRIRAMFLTCLGENHNCNSFFLVPNSTSASTFMVQLSRFDMGLSENVVYPIVPNGFADHYPVFKWLFHWEYTQHFQTNPYLHDEAPETGDLLRKTPRDFTVQRIFGMAIGELSPGVFSRWCARGNALKKHGKS